MDMWARYPMEDSEAEYLGRVGQQALEVVKAGSKDPLMKWVAANYVSAMLRSANSQNHLLSRPSERTT